MRPGRGRELVFSGTGALLVLGLLAALNGLGSFLYARLDLSEGGAYSVSAGTKAVLARLSDTLLVKVYYSPRLPPPYGVNGQYLRDLLGEYRAAGRGRVQVEFIDPEASDRRRKEAVEAGVPPLQLNVMSRGKFEAKEAFMGAVLLYRGRSELLPVIQGSRDLEYELTRRALMLVEPKPRRIGFVSGHGEKTHESPVRLPLFAEAGERLAFETVTLDKPLPEGLEALWILGPEAALKPDEVQRLRAWAASGRPLGLLLGRRQVDLRAFLGFPLKTGLEPLLKSWGLELSEGLVADPRAERIRLDTQYGQFVAMRVEEYPLIPVVPRLNPDHPASRGLEGVAFPYAHAITFKAPEGSRLRFTSLADSSERAALHAGADLKPEAARASLARGGKGPFSMAGVLEGFESAASTAPLRVAVVATPYQLHPSLADKANNAAFFLNLLDWSVQDEALLSIRAKGAGYRPLRPLSDLQAATLQAALIFLPAGSLVLGGLLMYRRARARRRALRALYAEPPAPRAAEPAGRET